MVFASEDEWIWEKGAILKMFFMQEFYWRQICLGWNVIEYEEAFTDMRAKISYWRSLNYLLQNMKGFMLTKMDLQDREFEETIFANARISRIETIVERRQNMKSHLVYNGFAGGLIWMLLSGSEFRVVYILNILLKRKFRWWVLIWVDEKNCHMTDTCERRSVLYWNRETLWVLYF